MIIGIDASNIKSDGGIVHLFELLNNLKFKKTKFKKIIIWGNKNALINIKHNPKIYKIYLNHKFNNLLIRSFWQFFLLPYELKKMKCDVFFVLGGIFFLKKIKTVSIFQNILPFIDDDIKVYPLIQKIKFSIQKIIYLNTFKKSDGIIFLSDFSKKILDKELDLNKKETTIIPHGVSDIFICKKKHNFKNKVKLLYVSKIDIYKKQIKIINIIKKLKNKIDVSLSLVGFYDKKNKAVLNKKIESLNLKKNVKLLGRVDYKKLPNIYRSHDIKIYASKSETFGMTMLEAMKSGLPVVAIKNQISKEILSDAGFFCNYSDKSLINNILKVKHNKKETLKKIDLGRKISQNYKWTKTSDKTFSFLEKFI